MKTLFKKIAAAVLLLVGVSSCAPKPEPVGLVLSGGGAKGAYEIGVWKALCETGVADRIQVFSGTSVGAINATLFASVRDADVCVRLWREAAGSVFTCNTNAVRDAVQTVRDDYESVTRDFRKDKRPGEGLTAGEKVVATLLVGLSSAVRLANKADAMLQGPSNSVGLCDSSRFRDVLRRSLPARWQSRPPFVHVTALAKDSGVARSFLLNGNERDRVIDCLMASSALPGVFDSVEIDGVAYVDGGWERRGGDNVPVRPIVERHPDVKTVIVVYLENEACVRRRVSPDEFPGVKLIEIFPSQVIGGAWGGVQGLFDLSQEKIDYLIRLGYEDAMRVLRPCG